MTSPMTMEERLGAIDQKSGSKFEDNEQKEARLQGLAWSLIAQRIQDARDEVPLSRVREVLEQTGKTAADLARAVRARSELRRAEDLVARFGEIEKEHRDLGAKLTRLREQQKNLERRIAEVTEEHGRVAHAFHEANAFCVLVPRVHEEFPLPASA